MMLRQLWQASTADARLQTVTTLPAILLSAAALTIALWTSSLEVELGRRTLLPPLLSRHHAIPYIPGSEAPKGRIELNDLTFEQDVRLYRVETIGFLHEWALFLKGPDGAFSGALAGAHGSTPWEAPDSDGLLLKSGTRLEWTSIDDTRTGPPDLREGDVGVTLFYRELD